MSGNLLGAVAVPLAALIGVVAIGAGSLLSRAWFWVVEWPARRRVRLAAERAAAERIGDLVPGQRESAENVVIPFQRRAGR